MGHSNHPTRYRNKFGLRELGVLDGPPNREFDALVEIATRAQNVSSVAFMVFDDTAGAIVMWSCFGPFIRRLAGLSYRLHGAIASDVREENKSLYFKDINPEYPTSIEAHELGAVGYIGSPVHDPTGEVAGVLATMSDQPMTWNALTIDRNEKLAHLMTQMILLRASMETLRMIATERHIAV